MDSRFESCTNCGLKRYAHSPVIHSFQEPQQAASSTEQLSLFG